MDHQEKVQMLDEVQEIRQLIIKLNLATAEANKINSSASGASVVPIGRNRRVLDLF
jgi:hypothetical protein